MIEFDCPQCAHHITAPNQDAGVASVCPKCNTAVTIPKASVTTSPNVATIARKPCPACGEMIAETAKKCHFCGEVFDASIAQPDGSAKPLLYNPNVASSLSVFFTPIFGSWCCRHNYQVLGLPDKARRSQIWLIVSIVYALLAMIVPGMEKTWLLFLTIWYFCDGRKQAQYLTENKIAYEKKSWQKPVLVGIGALVVTVILLILVYGLGEIIGGGDIKETLAKESVSVVNQIVTENFGANVPKCTQVIINAQTDGGTYNGTAFFANGKSLGVIIRYDEKNGQIEVEIPNQ